MAKSTDARCSRVPQLLSPAILCNDLLEWEKFMSLKCNVDVFTFQICVYVLCRDFARMGGTVSVTAAVYNWCLFIYI